MPCEKCQHPWQVEINGSKFCYEHAFQFLSNRVKRLEKESVQRKAYRSNQMSLSEAKNQRTKIKNLWFSELRRNRKDQNHCLHCEAKGTHFVGAYDDRMCTHHANVFIQDEVYFLCSQVLSREHYYAFLRPALYQLIGIRRELGLSSEDLKRLIW